MKGKFKRFIALFLVLAIILPVQELKVFAGTVSKNEVIEEDSNNKQAMNIIETKTVSGEDVGEETFFKTDVAGKEISHTGANEERMPSAPTHHCALDYTDFSYVYFGSYPQSEVMDSDTIVAIEVAITLAGIEENADLDTDVWVDGIKYRRVRNNHTGYFGDNDYRYFKWEKIKWKVLQNDGNTLFVVADTTLDCKHYHVGGVVTWEESTIRDWLNGNFYDTAFNSEEQKAVVEQNVVNEDNPEYGIQGGNDTRDKVYLLSINEVTKEEYGFCSNPATYSLSRMTKTSDYANVMGARRNYEGNCCWWLRSRNHSNVPVYVHDNGYVYKTGSHVNNYPDGVCPALHINLQSDIWSMQDEGILSENTIRTEEGIPTNPLHHCPEKEGTSDDTDWEYVYFGNYPQTEVAGSNLTSDIQNASYDENGDATVNGTRYRRISKGDTNYDGHFGYSDYRYFKWEKIKWKVLQNDGNTLFLMADSALDCKNYHDEGGEITWENSTIRNWLNGSFYDTAFNSEEKEAVVEQDVVNENNPEYDTEGGNDTKDKVYLLSIDEVGREAYGFCSIPCIFSSSRMIKVSDYAHVRGTSNDGEGNCWWWLRSPGLSSHSATNIRNNGYTDRGGGLVDNNYGGTCPVLHIDLSSNLWTIADEEELEEDLLTGIQASKRKTVYTQGETLNMDDLKVTAHYQSHPEKELPAGTYTTNAEAINMNTPGSKTLTISYTEGVITKTAAIAITVNPKADTTPKVEKGTKITDKTTAATYKVTSTDSEAPTVEYTGTTNQKKQTITIPEYVTYQGVKYKVTTVSAKSFKGNKKLTTIKIASSITKIGDNCFEGCTSLKTVTIGTGLKTIGKNAFKNCKNLKTLTIKSTKLKTVSKNAFKGINANCKIKVPAKKVKAYQKLMKKKGQKSTVKIGK